MKSLLIFNIIEKILPNKAACERLKILGEIYQSLGYNVYWVLNTQNFSCGAPLYNVKSINSKVKKILMMPFHALRLVINEQKFQVVYCRDFISGFFVICLFRGRKNILIDWRGVGVDELSYKKSFSPLFYTLILGRIEKYVFQHSSVNLFVSYKLKRHFQNKYGESRTFVVPNAVDDIFYYSESSSNKEIEYDFVYCANNAPWQYFRENINWLVCYANHFNRPCIVVTNDVEEAIANVSGRTNLVDVRSVNYTDLPGLYKKCKYGLCLRENNIINYVSCPTKICEYLASGLKVVISKGIGDFENFIIYYNYGVIVKDSIFNVDCIETLTSLPGTQPARFMSKRSIAKKFNKILKES